MLFDSSGAVVQFLFTNWIIPEQLAPECEFADLNAYNLAGNNPLAPTYPTTDQVMTLINNAIAELNSSYLQGAPLSFGVVPRVLYQNTLVDGLFQDDGTDIGAQTVNSVQFGDYGFEANGTYLQLNDAEGVANFFAGGDSQAQYAGLAALCAVGLAQVFLQATGYSYVFGENGVVVLGDGLNENNGTRVIIDDVTRLIKLYELPTSDPGVANALWKENGVTVKISQGAPSASSSLSASPSSSVSSSRSASPSSSVSASPSSSVSSSRSASPSAS